MLKGLVVLLLFVGSMAVSNSFILNEMLRLVYVKDDPTHCKTIYYDENWMPTLALKEVANFCNEHPEMGVSCTLETREEKQEALGKVWIQFLSTCKGDHDRDLSAIDWAFVRQPDMTQEFLVSHLTNNVCNAYNLRVPRFNVRTSITVVDNRPRKEL